MQSLSRDRILKVLTSVLSKYAVGAGADYLSEAVSIYQDGLWIGGDDAAEFLNEIHDTFGTSFEGFEFLTYFPNEHEMSSRVGRAFARLVGLKDDRKKILTVGHLADVIEKGAWFEPPELSA